MASSSRYTRTWQRRAALRLAAGDAAPTHGKASTYTNYGCRCEPCREAKSAENRAYRERRRGVTSAA